MKRTVYNVAKKIGAVASGLATGLLAHKIAETVTDNEVISISVGVGAGVGTGVAVDAAIDRGVQYYEHTTGESLIDDEEAIEEDSYDEDVYDDFEDETNFNEIDEVIEDVEEEPVNDSEEDDYDEPSEEYDYRFSTDPEMENASLALEDAIKKGQSDFFKSHPDQSKKFARTVNSCLIELGLSYGNGSLYINNIDSYSDAQVSDVLAWVKKLNEHANKLETEERIRLLAIKRMQILEEVIAESYGDDKISDKSREAISKELSPMNFVLDGVQVKTRGGLTMEMLSHSNAIAAIKVIKNCADIDKRDYENFKVVIDNFENELKAITKLGAFVFGDTKMSHETLDRLNSLTSKIGLTINKEFEFERIADTQLIIDQTTVPALIDLMHECAKKDEADAKAKAEKTEEPEEKKEEPVVKEKVKTTKKSTTKKPETKKVASARKEKVETPVEEKPNLENTLKEAEAAATKETVVTSTISSVKTNIVEEVVKESLVDVDKKVAEEMEKLENAASKIVEDVIKSNPVPKKPVQPKTKKSKTKKK